MSNFGFNDLRLVNAYDVAFREAKSAVNAGHVLEGAREFPTLADAISDCSLAVGTTSIGHRALEHPMRRLEYGGSVIRRRMAGERVALLFGSEKFGLANEDMAHCHWLMRIPTREEHGSMNLGQAVAICLYELSRRPSAVRHTPDEKLPAAAGELDRLTDLLLAALQQSGYVHARVADSTNMKIRRLIRRMHLSAHDAEIWLGMARQLKWKLDQCYPDSE